MSKFYFFRGTQYSRFDSKRDATDVGYPLYIAGLWGPPNRCLPPTGVDAAVNLGDGKTYFFAGSEFYSFDNKTDQVDPGYPLPIAGNWTGLTLDRVDACVNWGNGKAYFFRKNRYWRYDIGNEAVDKHWPKFINKPPNHHWSGLFKADIDGAINWGNGKVYFFKGTKYSRFDITKNTVEKHWPKFINKTPNHYWSGLFPSGVRSPVMLGFAGIDRLAYPGDAIMQQLWNTTNLTWTGFYLAPAPSQGNTSWMTRLAFLRQMGWGIAPIYVGQQQPEPNSPGSHNITAAQGTLDAADAIMLATTAGFSPESVIYLDIETGGPIQPGLAAYYQNWVQGVVAGGFRPGVYCSFLLARQFRTLDNRPVFWVFNISKFRSGHTATYQNPFPAPEPVFSSVEFAAAWQLAHNAVLDLPGNQSVRPMDFDSCSMRDPSRIP